MSNIKSVSEIIKELAEESSSNGKILILKENEENEILKSVLKMVLDPYHNFFIKNVPEELDESIDPAMIQSEGDMTEEALVSALESIDEQEISPRIFVSILNYLIEDEELSSLLHKIIAKDLECGVGASTVNKVWSGLIPVYKIMKGEEKAHLKSIQWPAFADEKIDGARCTVFISPDGSVEAKTSSGAAIKQLDHIKDELMQCYEAQKEKFFDGFIIDAELVIYDESGVPIPRRTINGIVSKARQGTASEEEWKSLQLVAFDLLSSVTQLDRGLDSSPLSQRRDKLHTIFSGLENTKIVRSMLVENENEAMTFFNFITKRGGEGVIVKNLDSFYECKKSKNWIKIKKEFEAEVRVVDIQVHSKNPDMVGSIFIQSEDEKVKGKVGTKMSDDLRYELMDLHRKGELLGRVGTIVFHDLEESKSREEKSFYLPRFITLRDDKEEADTLQKLIDMMG